MKKKNEVLSHFQKLKGRVEKEIGLYIRCLRSDGGKEYFSEEFTSYLQVKAFGEKSHADTHPNKME